MTNFKSRFTLFRKLFIIYSLIAILFSYVFFPYKISAVSSKAIIGPISVVGELLPAEQQMVFNQLREQINKRYHLVSHKILDLISEQGLISFDNNPTRGWFLFQISTSNDIKLFDGTTSVTLKSSYTTTNQWDQGSRTTNTN